MRKFLFILLILFFNSFLPFALDKVYSEEFCGRSTYGECSSDEDCISDGCSSQICRSINEESIFSTCEWRECYDAKKYNLGCKCVKNKCQWAKLPGHGIIRVQKRAVPSEYDYSNVLVTNVVDNETLRLENGEQVRLIGIDTSEFARMKKPYKNIWKAELDNQDLSQEALEFIKKLVEAKRVKIEFDLSKYDSSKRLLGYVYVFSYECNDLPGLIFLNAALLKKGYANLINIPPNLKYAELFQELYREAKENKRGLWK
ncbi:MAG: thermonuclease family protein [Candidatus Omnitrophica bacterium]|nr:thermonuclease family protein [Candidatus Omnitrophota bacterium]MBI5144952.1 thermonuclease family protein [Candidatus Omnitrophota bacterium]